MSMTLDLSATLRGKLASVARRIRLLRAVRGTALLLLTLAVTAGLALLADYAFSLAPVVRCVLLTLWVGLGSFVALVGLLLPVQRSLDPASLAALIEEKYPELGERLTSSVELSATPDAYHGSRALIALLLEETEVRTRPLDFLRTVSPRRPLQTAAAASVALLLAVTPAFVWPERFGELSERFLAPWRVLPVVVPYRVQAEPGDGFVKQGDPFTVSARLVRDRDDVTLPEGCTLVVTDAKTGETQRFRMLGNSPTAFSYKIERVGNSFRYHVEAGDARSRQHEVTSVVPVKLASTTITPVAPAYALKAKYADKPVDGIVDLTALQHSRVGFDLRFTRDAVRAMLLLTSVPGREGEAPAEPARQEPRPPRRASKEVKKTDPPVITVPLELTADRSAAKGEFTLAADVQARLVLEAEHGIRTEYGPVTLLARKDAPPSITFKSKEDLLPVSVNDRVPMLFSAEDDIAVTSAAIEYRINEGKIVAEEVKLEGAGTRTAEGKHEFALSGKVKHGDIVEYRIAVTDNRDVPEVTPPLTPQTSYYPPEGWLRLKVVNSVRPLNERDILAQRDDINRRLEKIKADLRVEKRQAYGVQQEARNDDRLSDDHQERLAQIRKDNQKSRQDLADLVREVGDTPALDPIARTADEVAEGELKRAQNDLDAAKSAKEPKKRYQEFSKADKELDAALRKLDELQKQNQRLAQQRLDQMQLQNLADRQQKLAELAAELAAKDPLRDASAPQQKVDIQREQNEVAAELQRLADQSEELRKSLDAARAEQAKDLAEKARELAQAQRDLAKASAETENKRQAERLSDLARRQQELAKKAAELARDTKQPAQTARVAPLKPQEADRAAKALEQGDANKALAHQDRSALELDRLTADLDRAVKVSDDPREAARQLARLEEALKKRVGDEARRRGDPTPLADRLKPLQQEQQAVAEAARQLSVPATNKEAEKAREQASRQAEQAAEALAQARSASDGTSRRSRSGLVSDAARAQQHIEQARKALERLAYELPDLNKRRQEARAEVERLRRQQEEIARQAEQAARQPQADPDSPTAKAEMTRRLQDAAKRQAEAAERLSKVDPAAQDERKERAERALNRALADLLDGRKEDVPASQAEAKRQLQRLEQALAGQKPSDEKAQELARQQQALADRAAKLAEEPKATPQQKAELQRQQQQVAQEAQGLDAPEAPRRKAEVAQATKQAEQAANAQPTGEPTQKKMQEAARALQRLVDQMKGKESEPARAERLAREQAEAAAEADRRARQNQQPMPEERQRQQQIAEEAKQLRGGEEGQAEKRRVQQALERVEKAPPNAEAAAQRQAADALRDLADKLAGRTDPAAKAQELARQQRELARQAQKPVEAAKQAEALRRAQQEQEELNRQLGRLDRKGAAEERKQAEAKMAEARKALEDARTPADAKPQLERAAQATEDLARKLGQEQAAQQGERRDVSPPVGKQTAAKPADQSPQRMAQQTAQQQRELARATQEARRQAERQGGEQGKQSLQKAMQQIGQEQQKLNQQASRLPANQNQKGLEQARQTMNEAQRALNRNDAAQAQRRQEEAARALEDLAHQLPQQQGERRDVSAPATRPQGLPNRQQAEQARQLAQQQRELRQAVAEAQRELARQADTPLKGPAQELARQQQEIARQAGELTRNVGKEQGQQAPSTQQARQAQQSTQQAANRLHAGALPQAQQAGQQAAQQLRQLAQQLGQTPRPLPALTPPGSPQAPDPADQARRLAQQQDEVNRRMQPLAQDASAQRAQQQARQQDLRQQTGDLMQELNRLAQQSWARNPQGAQQAQQAAQSTQQAQQSMQQAQQQARQGNQGQARQQQQQAAQALDRAAQQAAQAARQLASAQQQGTPSQQQGSPQQAQAGQAVQQAQKQMGQAQGQLNQGQNQAAQSSMKQAGQSLQQASQALAQSQQQQPGPPGSVNNKPTVGAASGGVPDLSRYGEEARKYQGKAWGELPGSLQTRIIQDLKDQFGDDYARRIKLYFEQVSNTRKK